MQEHNKIVEYLIINLQRAGFDEIKINSEENCYWESDITQGFFPDLVAKKKFDIVEMYSVYTAETFYLPATEIKIKCLKSYSDKVGNKFNLVISESIGNDVLKLLEKLDLNITVYSVK